MKYAPILLIFLLTGFASCKKEKQPQSPILGKWQEVKIRTYEADSTNKILYDTTYLHPFTSADYIQFDNDGTCVTSNDHYYYLNSPGLPKQPQSVPASTSDLKYSAIRSKYLLNTLSTLLNPGGFVTADTVSLLNSNTVMLHSVFYTHGFNSKIISDSYYNK